MVKIFKRCDSNKVMLLFEYLKLERTMYYGTCPVYKVEVDNEGNVAYFGGSFVKKEEKHTWKISPEEINKLNKLINNFDYKNFIFKPKGLCATCSPSCITTIKFSDGLIKTVDHDLGYSEFKNNLEKFENKIDMIIGITRLIK